MLSQALAWLRTNILVLGALGSLAVFIFYERRKKILEIRKLELEVAALRRETLIYRPTTDEIRAVLEQTGRIATRKLGIFGGQDPLEDFGVALQDFLTRLLVYYGDSEARLQIARQRLYNLMVNQRADEPSVDENEHPSTVSIVSKWRDVRPLAVKRLADEVVSSIDHLLGRFSAPPHSRLTGA